MIETIRDLIKELMDYNPDAKIFIGDNLYNHVAISYVGEEGCTKKNCDSVGFHIEGEDNCEKVNEEIADESCVESCDECAEHYVDETIVITDPCYLKHSVPSMETSTLYGDWSCMVYSGELGVNKDPEEWDEKYLKFYNDYNFGGKTIDEKEALAKDWHWFKVRWKEEHTLGEFCADSGRVGVFEWSRLTEEERKWVREHNWCAAVIPHVTGIVRFATVTDGEGNKSRHVVCEGKTKFFTTQSGF